MSVLITSMFSHSPLSFLFPIRNCQLEATEHVYVVILPVKPSQVPQNSLILSIYQNVVVVLSLAIVTTGTAIEPVPVASSEGKIQCWRTSSVVGELLQVLASAAFDKRQTDRSIPIQIWVGSSIKSGFFLLSELKHTDVICFKFGDQALIQKGDFADLRWWNSRLSEHLQALLHLPLY